MAKNFIERAITPYNPPENKLLQRQGYSLYAPVAARGKAGMAVFSEDDFDVSNGVVRLRYPSGSGTGGTGGTGGITREVDPTVPAWAKQPKKPTYTASEVGAASADALIALRNSAVGVPTYNTDTGIMTFKTLDGNTTKTIDLPIESILEGVELSEDGKTFIFTFRGDEPIRLELPAGNITLPTWVTDLVYATEEQLLIPPTTEAVKNYIGDIQPLSEESVEAVLKQIAYNVNTARSDKRYLVKLTLRIGGMMSGDVSCFISTDEYFNPHVQPGLDGNGDVRTLFDDTLIYFSDATQVDGYLSLTHNTSYDIWYLSYIEYIDGKYRVMSQSVTISILEHEVIDTKPSSSSTSDNSVAAVSTLPLQHFKISDSNSYSVVKLSDNLYGARLLLTSENATCTYGTKREVACANWSVIPTQNFTVVVGDSPLHTDYYYEWDYNSYTETTIEGLAYMVNVTLNRNNGLLTISTTSRNYLSYFPEFDYYVELEINTAIKRAMVRVTQLKIY